MACRGFTVAACALLAAAPTMARAQTPPPPGYQPVPATAPQAAPAAAPQPYPPGVYAQAAPGYGPPPTYYTTVPGGYTTVPGGYESQGPGPRVLDWEAGQPLQPGYHAETRIRRGLVVGGVVTFGVTYLTTALVGAGLTDSDVSGVTPLFVPVIGPFITIGTAHASSTGAFFLIVDGLAQAAGVAMFAAGVALPKTMQVRNDMARPSMRAVPMTFGASSAGIGLVGRF